MSRVIKFRAWDENRKTFWYSDDECYLLRIYGQDLWLVEDENFYKEGNKEYHKISNILHQFTGLLDKKGKEIYEGDIVSIMDCEPSLYKVCYWEYNFKWGVEYIGNDITNWQEENLEEFDSEHFEVIGNIYENGDLINDNN